MSMILTDLIIESVLREGFADIKANPEIIDDIFGTLISDYNTSKYGISEINKIKAEIAKTDWSFVNSFSEVHKKVPSVSIQLLDDTEVKEVTFLGDEAGDIETKITSISELTVLFGINADNYESVSGKLNLPDSIDLTDIYLGMIYQDSNGVQFPITGGINNTPGNKGIHLAPGLPLTINNISGRIIKKRKYYGTRDKKHL